jgi:hypothetical protein
LLLAETSNVNQKSLDRLPFIRKQIVPAVKLFIDKRKKREREALENAVV